jgi:hydrogenase maturation protein HypF
VVSYPPPCILKKDKAFLTQYIGNTTRLRTLEYLESAVHNLMELTGVEKVDAVAVDRHPSFNTSLLGGELSRKFDAPLVKCQHHFAHAASLQAEGSIEKMVCITADGVGFGNDGTSWGGEIILVDNGFERAGHLVSQLMPGGDLAARYPARMAAGILSNKFSQGELSKIFMPYFGKNELDIILKQIETGFNSPFTSSTGRILDAVAALLGVCMERTYEGEPAMKLEAFSRKGRDIIDMPVRIEKRDGKFIFDTTELIEAVYLARDDGRLPDIAASAQSTVAAGLCEMAMKVARDRQIGVIGFSGGVGYNEAMIMKAGNMAQEEGFEFVIHTKVPCGDGGISLGQALIGSRMSNLDM